MKKITLISTMLFFMLFSSCMEAVKVTTKYAVPAIAVTEGAIKATEVLDEREEYYLGRSVGVNILKSYKLYTNPKHTEYVDLVGNSVAMHSDNPETYGGYHFAILDSKEINAFACPGGIIFITKGLLDMLKTEDELAAVLAHEVSHVNNKDGMNSVQTSRWTQLAAILGSAAARTYGSEGFGKIVGVFENSVNDIVSTIVVNGYSKDQEFAADGMAVRILGASGYDSGAIKRVLAAYGEREKSDHQGFFKTHPGAAGRMKRLEMLAQEDKPENATDGRVAAQAFDSRKKRFEDAFGR
ncbi:M48 family metalloprotease [Desulforegula conservatrix]|uniref:M48 family metalloprotease n=1 Tax=Desulforegula conservatrix TaxID=153026 RepID=UPI0003F591CB|nr:M48 family metalloprotease [Desulforegula conservatrix]